MGQNVLTRLEETAHVSVSSGFVMCQVPFSPSPKAERGKKGVDCTRIAQGWSLTIALTSTEFNHVTVSSIDVFPVAVFSVIAQSFVVHLLLWLCLCTWACICLIYEMPMLWKLLYSSR